MHKDGHTTWNNLLRVPVIVGIDRTRTCQCYSRQSGQFFLSSFLLFTRSFLRQGGITQVRRRCVCIAFSSSSGHLLCLSKLRFLVTIHSLKTQLCLWLSAWQEKKNCIPSCCISCCVLCTVYSSVCCFRLSVWWTSNSSMMVCHGWVALFSFSVLLLLLLFRLRLLSSFSSYSSFLLLLLLFFFV